jgi:DNA-binding PadR family transcriptional regulator
MAIGADLIRGCTDIIILRFLNEGDTYGYAVNKEIQTLSDGRYTLNEATLYTAFRRMEKEGWIRSYWGEGGSGARRRYYAITAQGRQAYADNLKEWKEAVEILERLVEK